MAEGLAARAMRGAALRIWRGERPIVAASGSLPM